MTKGRTKLKSW